MPGVAARRYKLRCGADVEPDVMQQWFDHLIVLLEELRTLPPPGLQSTADATAAAAEDEEEHEPWYRPPEGVLGKTLEPSTAFHARSRPSVAFHGLPRTSTAFHGLPHEPPTGLPLTFHALPLTFHEPPTDIPRPTPDLPRPPPDLPRASH